MTEFRLEHVHSPHFVTLPDGVTVGDEFRIAGRVRVTAMAEEDVDVTGYGDKEPRITNGETSVRLRLTDFTTSSTPPERDSAEATPS